MKVYIIKESDFDGLLALVDRDPKYGTSGGSSNASVRDPITEQIYSDVHRFYNYQVRGWIDAMKKD